MSVYSRYGRAHVGLFCVVVDSGLAVQCSGKDTCHLSFSGKEKKFELDPYRYAPFYTWGFRVCKEVHFSYIHMATALVCQITLS